MEIAQKINSTGNLVGIVHVPEVARSGKPAFIFVSAGMLHRTGPYGFYTQAARELANMGFHVLRFDLSGIGDSEHQNNDLDFSEQSQQDIAAAIDLLCDSYKCETIISAGLCSGADDSIIAANRDERIKALFLLDGPGFRTPRFSLNRLIYHYPQRLLNKQKWSNKLSKIGSLFDRNQKKELRLCEIEDRPLMEKENLIPMVETLVNRQVKMHFLFTGGVFQYYNYTGQTFDMFKDIDLRDMLTESFHSDCDHLFLLHKHRLAVLNNLLSWTKLTFVEEDGTTEGVEPQSELLDNNNDDNEFASKAA